MFVEERSPDFFEARNPVLLDIEVAEGWKTKDNMESQYIKILEFQIRYFDNIWHYSNPIIIIQRRWRKSLAFKRETRKSKQVRKLENEVSQQLKPSFSQEFSILKSFFNQWKRYSSNLIRIKNELQDTETYPEDKEYLTLPLQEYRSELKRLKVMKLLRRFTDNLKYFIFIKKMSKKIYQQLKRKHIEFS